ncbi:MAG: cytochrome c [Microthrixaceae bacterium]|nr:cytochrome c [Microthrixaceae bacterium]
MTALLAIQTTQRSIGYAVLALVVLGGIAFFVNQLVLGRREAGSEIELAPNRGPDLPDEELEGRRLNIALWSALGLLVVIALTLPLYWLAEGGRQVGAVKKFEETFVRRGEILFGTDPLEGSQCETCHGPKGTGGSASFVITNEDGEYVDTVTWAAPALNTVMWRFSNAEVKDILTYGRPGTPMQPWGVEGGGALSDQQLDELLEYMWSVQLTEDEMHTELLAAVKAVDEGLADRLAKVQEANASKLADDPMSYDCVYAGSDFACLEEGDQLRLGEIVFNMSSTSGGAYSCARCHVPGASFGKPYESIDVIARGRYGPNLEGIEKDLTVKQHFALIMQGSEAGKIYGANHQGDGRMPGFGINPNNGDTSVPQLGKGSMYTPEVAWAVMVYERNLSTERAAIAARSTTAKAGEQ